MRQKIWILLCLLSAIAIILVSLARHQSPVSFDNPPDAPLSQQPADPVPTLPEPSPLSMEFRRAPAVVPSRLMADLEALAFDRSTPDSRELSREYIRRRLVAAGWTLESQPFAGEGINLIAKKTGRNPDAGSILLGAHYDTVPGSAGASDNGSGVAVLLEVARLLQDRETERSLELAFFDLEEIGLHGSFAFASDPNLIADLRGAIVVDMVGYACYQAGCQAYPSQLPIQPPSARGDFVAVIGDTEHLPLLEVFQMGTAAELPPVYTLPVPFKGLLIPDTLRSDHAPFWYHGIGAVLVTDTGNLRSPHYHQPSDTPLQIDQAFFIGSAQRIADATVTLLESEGSLQTNSVRTEVNLQR
ncbi:M28 family peptidase [Laspinema olomoucense]|uniref:M28 family peptidase n=1 Tax=Laspinema olomoucense D3b TaxID=2953688 RepID=A0ABT2NB07_9CYAN|nr:MULTISPECIES: M28 family peptidase [unclassified Laspinema]MCT7975413.1 M28 family peptidase [Laspinema sp. D3d]MCT7978530.1 M28 family peptidase [Laspinema sp. D3b]MCT7991365.1 M28 family peptidase [Laspinema sp. D3a]